MLLLIIITIIILKSGADVKNALLTGSSKYNNDTSDNYIRPAVIVNPLLDSRNSSCSQPIRYSPAAQTHSAAELIITREH
jgi:hypothetical protein